MANETVICTYRVRPDAEERFVELLTEHRSTLHSLGFVTDEPWLVYRSLDEPPTYIEIFTWVEGGFDQAHDHPDVLAMWESMDHLLEERAGLPKWDFPHFAPVELKG
jgi:hypothetical protein